MLKRLSLAGGVMLCNSSCLLHSCTIADCFSQRTQFTSHCFYFYKVSKTSAESAFFSLSLSAEAIAATVIRKRVEFAEKFWRHYIYYLHTYWDTVHLSSELLCLIIAVANPPRPTQSVRLAL